MAAGLTHLSSIMTTFLLLLLAAGGYSLLRIYGIVRWKTYIWLADYFTSADTDPKLPDDKKHLIFVMADHYEPGYGDQGVEVNRSWLEAFEPIAEASRDRYGNCFRYTWFYPYDHRNEPVLAALSEMARKGYGEVELHWHHPPATTETFPGMLKEAIAWFQRHGALITSGPNPQTRFAFIHGNWALDNSHPTCGVNNELDILFRHGCYADFTFSTIGSKSQPSKVNSIYYVLDTGKPKSYDRGVDARVGNPVDDRLMIFEGPLMMEPLSGRLEYGAIEAYALPAPARIARWIDANIHVRGRPEWVFAKVYSHGCQSENEILRKHLGPMLASLAETCRKRGIALHYMTAREAYNVAKAAEDGKVGDPEDYRDYKIPKPRNMVVMGTAHFQMSERAVHAAS
jgi:hypothetical protein